MKWIKYLLLFLVLAGCNRVEKVSPEALKPLVGRWQLVAQRNLQSEEKEWVEVPAAEASFLIIRYDGVVLDAEGRGLCCGPGTLKLNGTEYPIEPKAEVPFNDVCALVNCAGCPVWDIALDGDTFVLTGCWGGGQSRYARVR